jgi:hypothetical protein
MFSGLPGGSSPEGPATTAGCLFVTITAAVAFSLLFALLWYTASLISSGN